MPAPLSSSYPLNSSAEAFLYVLYRLRLISNEAYQVALYWLTNGDVRVPHGSENDYNARN